jgi:lipid-A-disaccharide synthase
MLIAGEASGDMLAAELVRELRRRLLERCSRPTRDVQPLYTSIPPEFFGAGGPRMGAEGVEIAVDMTPYSVVGLVEVLKKLWTFKRLFEQLLTLAIHRQPDIIVCVDFSGFNRRFAHAVKQYVRSRRKAFLGWNPKIVQFVSPQTWASREKRAHKMARDFDLVLSIFPFEKKWYATRVPTLRVEFVGHPLIDRFATFRPRIQKRAQHGCSAMPSIVLLPGSRSPELKRHLPVMLAAAQLITKAHPIDLAMVLPNEQLVAMARRVGGTCLSSVKVRVGGLAEALLDADIAIASTGTVTMECAFFGVPTVAIYISSWSTYQIGKRIIRVAYLAMPNLLAQECLFPEFIQRAATPHNIAREVNELLASPTRCEEIRRKLASVIDLLGTAGAADRAAAVIVRLLFQEFADAAA